MPVYYHVSSCIAARALVHCQRYALKQMFKYYYYYYSILKMGYSAFTITSFCLLGQLSPLNGVSSTSSQFHLVWPVCCRYHRAEVEMIEECHVNVLAIERETNVQHLVVSPTIEWPDSPQPCTNHTNTSISLWSAKCIFLSQSNRHTFFLNLIFPCPFWSPFLRLIFNLNI